MPNPNPKPPKHRGRRRLFVRPKKSTLKTLTTSEVAPSTHSGSDKSDEEGSSQSFQPDASHVSEISIQSAEEPSYEESLLNVIDERCDYEDENHPSSDVAFQILDDFATDDSPNLSVLQSAVEFSVLPRPTSGNQINVENDDDQTIHVKIKGNGCDTSQVRKKLENSVLSSGVQSPSPLEDESVVRVTIKGGHAEEDAGTTAGGIRSSFSTSVLSNETFNASGLEHTISDATTVYVSLGESSTTTVLSV